MIMILPTPRGNFRKTGSVGTTNWPKHSMRVWVRPVFSEPGIFRWIPSSSHGKKIDFWLLAPLNRSRSFSTMPCPKHLIVALRASIRKTEWGGINDLPKFGMDFCCLDRATYQFIPFSKDISLESFIESKQCSKINDPACLENLTGLCRNQF